VPASNEREAVREIETMYLAAIRTTHRSLYLENQYFTSERIAQAIIEQLDREPALEGLLVGLDQPQTAVEYHTMGYGRARFHQLLRDAGVEDRVPMVAAFSAGTAINVHSKLAIFDDRALTVGSANLNRRSMGFDVECNILLEAASEAHRQTIQRLRNRLLAEHLGSESDEIDALVRAHGIARLPELIQRTRRLVRVDPQQHGANFGPLLAPLFDREADWPPLSVPLPTMDKAKLPRTALFAGLMTAAAFTSTVVAEELPRLASLQKLVTQLLGE
jgi:phosphatidylserine/phosphatidylglycerophosphate/cardiolipin synthase-like enzyme